MVTSSDEQSKDESDYVPEDESTETSSEEEMNSVQDPPQGNNISIDNVQGNAARPLGTRNKRGRGICRGRRNTPQIPRVPLMIYNWASVTGNNQQTFQYVGIETFHEFDGNENVTPIMAYDLFVNEEVIDIIVGETNRQGNRIRMDGYQLPGLR